VTIVETYEARAASALAPVALDALAKGEIAARCIIPDAAPRFS